MLYELNGKIYIKPFPNKIIEVEITKNGNEYNAKLTKKIIELIPETKAKLVEITIEDAYKKKYKTENKVIDTL